VRLRNVLSLLALPTLLREASTLLSSSDFSFPGPLDSSGGSFAAACNEKQAGEEYESRV
jgi:hypothetical protein